MSRPIRGKGECVRQLAERAGVEPPDSVGGTVPRGWLHEVLRRIPDFPVPPGGLDKVGLLRWSLENSGVAWDEAFASSSGSTITASGLEALVSALERAPNVGSRSPNELNLGGVQLGLYVEQQGKEGRVTQIPANQMGRTDVVDIRPGIAVLSVLRHLNYKPWYALAEFVDNAVQSFIANRDSLEKRGQDAVSVSIEIDSAKPQSISIRDDAGGIARTDFPRAFRPAQAPPDRNGLSEFGMGMKSAACWFAPRWRVTTSAIGEEVVRTVRFDIARIVERETEALSIESHSTERDMHFTEVVLEEPFSLPRGRTIGKLKDHLTDIYREFIRDGSLVLSLNGEELEYVEPEILVAPYFRDKDSEPLQWRRGVDIELPGGKRVRGYAGILKKGSTARAGFSLFRRRRVIQGTGDEHYRPLEVFGGPNTFRYQRVFGELHMEGFEVSHTKDGVKWGGLELEFVSELKRQLGEPEPSLLRQADGYRVRPDPVTVKKAAETAVAAVASDIQGRISTVSIDTSNQSESVATDPDPDSESDSRIGNFASREFEVTFLDVDWHVSVAIQYDGSYSQWLQLSLPNAEGASNGDARELRVTVSATHPFMERFVFADAEDMEAVLRICAALALAEVAARESGVSGVGLVRLHMNRILSEALSGTS